MVPDRRWLRKPLRPPVVEEVALRPSRNHPRQNVSPVTAVGGCGLWLEPTSDRRAEPFEFSCSFQEYEPISLWITGLSVGGI